MTQILLTIHDIADGTVRFRVEPWFVPGVFQMKPGDRLTINLPPIDEETAAEMEKVIADALIRGAGFSRHTAEGVKHIPHEQIYSEPSAGSKQRTLEVLRLVEETLMEIYDQEQQDRALAKVREEIAALERRVNS